MLTAARRRVRRLRRTAPDAGITLTELIVTATLMSIVGAITLTFFVGSSRATGDTTDANLANASARTAVNAWTALLQVAVSPDPQQPAARNLTLTSTALSFSAALQNRNAGCSGTGACSTNGTTDVTLATRTATVDGRQVTQLVQTLTTATGSTTTVPVRADVALPSGASCLFTARDIQGTDLGCALTAATSADVARIDLAFAVTPPGGRTQTFRTSVALPGNYS